MGRGRSWWPMRYRLRAVPGAQAAAEAVAVVAELRLLQLQAAYQRRHLPAVAVHAGVGANSNDLRLSPLPSGAVHIKSTWKPGEKKNFEISPSSNLKILLLSGSQLELHHHHIQPAIELHSNILHNAAM